MLMIKRFIKSLFLRLLLLMNKHPKFKLFFIGITKRLGLFELLWRIKLRSHSGLHRIAAPNEQRSFSKQQRGIIAQHAEPVVETRKRLAFVSPLPPLRSGISDYSADLLPLLAKFYDIDVIVDQELISDPWVVQHCTVRSADWLIDHAANYDRVLYHFGNSPFHEYMFDLLDAIPGVVVLHDFFLGHATAKRYAACFNDYLYQCHGYKALVEQQNTGQAIWPYPLNLKVLQSALTVITHSACSAQLAKQFYGEDSANNWPIIPLLRTPPKPLNKALSRLNLKIPADAFVVCSFGMTGETKLNHRLLDAWLASELSQHKQCYLIFVGENARSSYGHRLANQISLCGLSERVFITHWVDSTIYENYLSAADISVQLRARSRGETSAAVLDCMNYGLATVVNAHGSMIDLPDDAVYKLADDFDDGELTHALERLWQDTPYRHELIHNAQKLLASAHAPNACAEQYIATIESTYYATRAQADLDQLQRSLKHLNNATPELKQLKSAVAQTQIHAMPIKEKQLLVDVSAIVVNDLKTGIERVVRAQLEVLLQSPPVGYRVEPVFLTHKNGYWHYQYAYEWTLMFLNLPASDAPQANNPALLSKGDILFCADLNTGLVVAAEKTLYFQYLMSSGIHVYFQVFDLLPILHPEWFPKEVAPLHVSWAKVVANSSGALCISQSVAHEFNAWSEQLSLPVSKRHSSYYFHLGADIQTSSPSRGMPNNSAHLLSQLANSSSFLMVGTIEPRKGHQQTLDAFNQLWQQNAQVNLVIAGKAGWLMEELVSSIRLHPELNHRLFWLEGISDEFLDQLYGTCACLIAASEGEGFGLPLIEASHHHLPIIARDIPVFKEVAGEFASYFSGTSADALAAHINAWLEGLSQGVVISSKNMPRLSWRESTEMLARTMGLTLSA